jgi:hypothetical protein
MAKSKNVFTKLSAVPDGVEKPLRRVEFIDGMDGDELWYTYMLKHIEFRCALQTLRIQKQFESFRNRSDPKLKIQAQIEKLREKLDALSNA